MSAATTLRYEPPRIDGSRACFAFHTTPPSAAYREQHFELRFPPGLDLAAVPERLWWLVLLLCTQPQWPILGPCRIELPVSLPAAEIEFWLRLSDAALSTLSAYRREPAPPRRVEIVAAGPPLPPIGPRPESSPDALRCALAFSSGKDSLLHAALLRELTAGPPILVTTTSPLRELSDQRNAHRRELLRRIASRVDFEHYEIISDVRPSWDNAFPGRLGYPVATSELSDTFVYMAATLVVAWLRGATHLFLASENEVQESVVRDGRVVQHSHFMYSAATQRALDALLRPLGLRFGSLTWGLPTALVVRLLWRRYRDLAPLQYSCWRVDESAPTCSRCTQCLRIAFQILEAGADPAEAGFDLARLMGKFRRSPWRVTPPPDALPSQRAGWASARAANRAIALAPWRALVQGILAPHALQAPPRPWRRVLAVGQAALLKWRTRSSRHNPEPLADPGFFALADPVFRDRLRDVVAAECRFADSDEPLGRGRLERSLALTEWITAPLAAAP